MANKSTTKESNEKQFGLKQIELNVLGNINARHNAEQLDFLTFVALERLNYQVTENTRFRVDEEGKLYVSEPEAPTAEEVSVA